MALGSNVDENKCDEVCDSRYEDGSVAIDGEISAADNADHADSPGYKRRSLRGKPRIPSAVDTSRLNKHLTSIWSSKRKKINKKCPSSVLADSLQAPRSDLLMETDVDMLDHVGATAAEDETTALRTQASTVIIVKTLPQKEAESYHSRPSLNKVSEDKSSAPKGIRDIAERLRARKERLTASLGGSGFDASVNHSGQVTCELCAESVDDYAQLVRHVCQQHQDCTYVRNYLDEIQPIADALSAVSLPCEACGRTFAGQAALAAHRHECSTVSKLGAQRRRVTASLLSPSEHAADHSQQNGATKRSQKPTPGPDRICVHCQRTFGSKKGLAKHVSRVHSETDSKQQASGARRVRRSAAAAASKSAAAAAGTPPTNSSSSSSVSGSAGGGRFQRCDHCSACFSRTSLLVTHMRYCLKADGNK